MKLSTRSRYGLLSMYELAVSQPTNEPVTLKTIATKWALSEAYLEQLFASLKKAGLLTSKRGAQGGYFLARPANEITIGEILRALEGSVSVTECLISDKCGDDCRCPSRPIFLTLQKSIDDAMASMTLMDMLDDESMLQEEVDESNLS